MAGRISEFHGYQPLHPMGQALANAGRCPFIDDKCIKQFGACSLQPVTSGPVIICPNRLYAQSHQFLRDIAEECFGPISKMLTRQEAMDGVAAGTLSGDEAVVFGRGFGGELSIPSPRGTGQTRGGSFHIDFVVAKVSPAGSLIEFAAVEVQSIDTTGSYKDAAEAYLAGQPFLNDRGSDQTTAGLNWENVTKRILPQVIYKGNVLKREALCKKGLFFVLPHQVYEKIITRIGGTLQDFPVTSGTVTFQTYDFDHSVDQQPLPLKRVETFTTTVEQIAYAFINPTNLPDRNSYADAITKALLG